MTRGRRLFPGAQPIVAHFGPKANLLLRGRKPIDSVGKSSPFPLIILDRGQKPRCDAAHDFYTARHQVFGIVSNGVGAQERIVAKDLVRSRAKIEALFFLRTRHRFTARSAAQQLGPTSNI